MQQESEVSHSAITSESVRMLMAIRQLRMVQQSLTARPLWDGSTSAPDMEDDMNLIKVEQQERERRERVRSRSELRELMLTERRNMSSSEWERLCHDAGICPWHLRKHRTADYDIRTMLRSIESMQRELNQMRRVMSMILDERSEGTVAA